MEMYFFYAFSFISIISTIKVIISKNPVYALMYLIITLSSISGIFFSIGDYLAGSLEIIIYTGAIMVLFIFVIMMLNEDYTKKKNEIKFRYLIPTIITLFFLFFIINYFWNELKDKKINIEILDPKIISLNLLNHNMLSLELSSIVLLAGLIVTINIIKKK
ncbi:NADH-quinone oxidoreductase subunit J family protein [Candidatus Annandia pinicola]|uniref:NADH-quinone oxidoreductase subunit J family protein n=1 Tax=Candidatus Annandia pinicola TaxID=1345117 RepID=UPI001D02950E|nr:NADH-quinone oxidoreductase subunit J [Candidatus Annandia pinicola]UDG80305.1 NADH-quinone oxidoreductase subunit J [Candidatus Annandia pinicola]